MPHDLTIPEVGESVQEVQIGQWLVAEGDWVDKDQAVVEIDTDKASLEIYAPVAGIITQINKQNGESAEVGEVVGTLEESDKPAADRSSEESPESPSSEADEDPDAESDAQPDEPQRAENEQAHREESKASRKEKKSKAGKSKGKSKGGKKKEQSNATLKQKESAEEADESNIMPAARRLLEEHDLSAGEIESTGPGGRLTKEDVLRYLDQNEEGESEGGKRPRDKSAAASEPDRSTATNGSQKTSNAQPAAITADDQAPHRQTERVRMSLIRRRIAARLVEAQQQAALLTTVNEIDMTDVMQLRKDYRDRFIEKYEIKLGFMSFFVKAVIEGLKEFPAINAKVEDDHIIYHNYFDIGIAIGGGKGLVVPVLRNAERMSFAEIEQSIDELAKRAQKNKLTPDELEGGTFTITNGGIYGSLLSSPIVNPPQSGVLGMHSIQERPVARDGQVVIRPMMYVALTYDHRLVDGREAVTFLRRVKETLEDPTRMLLEV